MCLVIISYILTALELNIFQKKLKNSYEVKSIITNIYRIQAYDSIMCRYFCIAFIDFMLKGESLLDYTNLFSPNKYEKNNKIILKYLQQLNKLRWKYDIALFVLSIEIWKT